MTPSLPASPGLASRRRGGNAAALTNQLLQAQSSLLQAQNQLFDIWINYLTVRMQLYRDLELMPLDFRGVWIDELANLLRDPGGTALETTGCPEDENPTERPWKPVSNGSPTSTPVPPAPAENAEGSH